MAGKSVEDLLDSWGLSKYKETFREQNVTLEALHVLSKDHIDHLVPSIGDNALLLAHINGLREGASSTNVPSERPLPAAENIADISISNILNDSLFYNVSTPTSSGTQDCETATASVGAYCTYVVDPEPSWKKLRNYLESTNEGRALLINYEGVGLLENAARRKLSYLIISQELVSNPNTTITSQKFYQLACDIVKIFKKESVPVYFSPYISVSPTNKIAAKGKLLDMYRQRRREFSRSGLIVARKRKSSTSSSCSNPGSPLPSTSSIVAEATNKLPDPTDAAADAAEDILKWLKNSCDPWMTVELYWEQTRKARFKKICESSMTIADYFSEFRALGQSGGVDLLLQDFINLYPDNNDKLFENWPLHRDKLIEAAKKRTDPALKEFRSCLSGEDVDNDVINTAAFMLLAFLMKTTRIRKAKVKKQWRPSKLECLQGFITHIKSPADLEASITLHREKLSSLGYSVQPYIIIIGTSIAEIHTRYIVVNNVKYSPTSYVRYNSTSFMHAVDKCFKIMFALNAEYPSESANVWHFIQKGLYKLTTKYDKVYTSGYSLMSDLGISDKLTFSCNSFETGVALYVVSKCRPDLFVPK